MSDLDAILAARKSRHGHFPVQADVSQALKALVRGELARAFRSQETAETVAVNWRRMSPHQREGLEMILHKVARIMAGDPHYDDHWRDIAGYAQRVEETLERTI